MAVVQLENGKDDLKTQFITREGTYRLMTLSEYSRPNRVGYQSNQSSPQVRVSIVNLPTVQTPTTSNSLLTNNGQDSNCGSQGGDRICFNFGKELYVYAYRGVKKVIFVSFFYIIY